MEKINQDNGAHSYTEAATYEGEKSKPNIFKPILFNTEIVQAILAGRKTQTRRIVKYSKIIENPKIGFSAFTEEGEFEVRGVHENGQYGISIFKLKYKKGDILWVQETFQKLTTVKNGITDYLYKYEVDLFDPEMVYWTPSIHMPKEAARIFLKVINVRCERLNDISESDAIAEGIQPGDVNKGIIFKNYLSKNTYTIHPTSSFQSLWDSINEKKHPWKSNPFVWVYEFERIEKPADFN